MAEYLKASIGRYRRLYPRHMKQLDELTNLSIINKDAAFYEALISQEVLSVTEEDIVKLATENPGLLTQDQITLITRSLKESIERLERMKRSIDKPIEKQNEIVVESKVAEISAVKKILQSDIQPTNSLPMTLAEMRNSLGLDRLNATAQDSKKEEMLRYEIMDEILNTTTRMRHVGEKLGDQIKEGNVSLNTTQEMTDNNIVEAENRTNSMTELRSRSWWTIFRDLKNVAIGLIVFFVCLFFIILLPKAR